MRRRRRRRRAARADSRRRARAFASRARREHGALRRRDDERSGGPPPPACSRPCSRTTSGRGRQGGELARAWTSVTFVAGVLQGRRRRPRAGLREAKFESKGSCLSPTLLRCRSKRRKTRPAGPRPSGSARTGRWEQARVPEGVRRWQSKRRHRRRPADRQRPGVADPLVTQEHIECLTGQRGWTKSSTTICEALIIVGPGRVGARGRRRRRLSSARLLQQVLAVVDQPLDFVLVHIGQCGAGVCASEAGQALRLPALCGQSFSGSTSRLRSGNEVEACRHVLGQEAAVLADAVARTSARRARRRSGRQSRRTPALGLGLATVEASTLDQTCSRGAPRCRRVDRGIEPGVARLYGDDTVLDVRPAAARRRRRR